jgi:hypothetical protein
VATLDDDGIHLNLTREQVRDLPSVQVDPPEGIAPTG